MDVCRTIEYDPEFQSIGGHLTFADCIVDTTRYCGFLIHLALAGSFNNTLLSQMAKMDRQVIKLAFVSFH
jgi:hypothetical protein